VWRSWQRATAVSSPTRFGGPGQAVSEEGAPPNDGVPEP
jgi:hypothetical protein